MANKFLQNSKSIDEVNVDVNHFPSAKLLNEIGPYEKLAQHDLQICFGHQNADRYINWRKFQNILLGHWEYYMYEPAMQEDVVDSYDHSFEEEPFVTKKTEIPKVLLCPLSDDEEDPYKSVSYMNTENLNEIVSKKV